MTYRLMEKYCDQDKISMTSNRKFILPDAKVYERYYTNHWKYPGPFEVGPFEGEITNDDHNRKKFADGEKSHQSSVSAKFPATSCCGK